MNSTGTVQNQNYLAFSNEKKRFPEPAKLNGTYESKAGAYNCLEGVGTQFLTNFQPGDYVYINSAEIVRQIDHIQSDTRIFINLPVNNIEVQFTPANVEIGDIFTITMPDKSTVSFTATVATVANVTAGLFTAWGLLTVGVFNGFTPLDNTTNFQITSKNPWLAVDPFKIATAAVDGGGTDDQTLSLAVTDNGGITSEDVWRFPDELYREWSILNSGATNITLSTAIGDKQTIKPDSFVESKDVGAFGPLVVDGSSSDFSFLGSGGR